MFQANPIARRFGTLAAIAIFGVGALMVSLAPSDASAGTQLSLSGASAQSGQSFSTTASVTLAAADELNGFDLTISFNPAVAVPTSVQLNAAWNIPLDAGTIGSNSVHVAASRIGTCTGSCPLFSLNWNAVGAGNGQVQSTSLVLVGKQSSVAGNLSQVSTSFGTVSVSGPATNTAVPPTSTSTRVPATSTSIAATNTSVPPTSTSVPATSTPIPPTATSAPATATSVAATPTNTVAASSGGNATTPTAQPTSPSPTAVPTLGSSVDGVANNSQPTAAPAGPSAPQPAVPTSVPAQNPGSPVSPVVLPTTAVSSPAGGTAALPATTRTVPLPPNTGMGWAQDEGGADFPLRTSGYTLMGIAALLLFVQFVNSRQSRTRREKQFSEAVDSFFAEQEEKGSSRSR